VSLTSELRASPERQPADDESPLVSLPPEAIELIQWRSASIENRLGYFRDEPLVIFGYCPGGGEVIWKDGHSSGFGTGSWKVLLYEIAPLAACRGVNLGSINSAGTHVLLMDRVKARLYAVPRTVAEDLLARAYHIAESKRPCLCSLMACASCPVKTCCRTGHPGDGLLEVFAPPRGSPAG
jgi:hypothetical protein